MAKLDGTKIGFIGLGIMGKPMARNLKAEGAELFIHNRSREVVDELAAEGMTACANPREVAEKAGPGLIFLMLSDMPAVAAVLEDEDGLLAALQPGALVVDMGTTAVSATRRFAEQVAEAGATWMDAPVSGGQVAAEGGFMTIMAGGSAEDFERALPAFQVMGDNINHLGDVSAGQVAKAANQLIVALTIDAVAEALSLAKAAGVDPERVRQALMGGFAASRILELHGKRMTDGTFEPGGRATTQRKDVQQVCELADELGIDLPTLRHNLRLWDRMIDQGDGDLDHSGLIRIYQKPE